MLPCFLLDVSNERLLGRRGPEARGGGGPVDVGRRPRLPLLQGLFMWRQGSLNTACGTQGRTECWQKATQATQRKHTRDVLQRPPRTTESTDRRVFPASCLPELFGKAR